MDIWDKVQMSKSIKYVFTVSFTQIAKKKYIIT